MLELLDFKTVVTLLVLVWVIVGFLSSKWSMGCVAMTGLVILEITGVLSFNDAFSYFASTNVIMVGGCFVLSGALQKTRLVTQLRQWILSHVSSGTAIVLIYLLACCLLVQLVMPTALVSMLLPFMAALDDDSPVQPSNLLFPGVITAHAAQGALPLGTGLTAFVTMNALLEANGSTSTVNVFDPILIIFPSLVVVLLYFVFIGWKLLPRHTIDTSKIKEYKEAEITIDAFHERLIYIVFTAAMVIIILANLFPNFPIDMYVAPVMADVILVLTGCMNVTDVRNSMNIDTLFMLAGILPLATAMQQSNAATLVSTTIMNLLGGHPSYPVFLLAFMLVGGILTQFMSNTASNNVFTPLAIVTAVGAGFDPRGVVIALTAMTTAAMLTPMASPSLAIAYGAGGYTEKDILKACLPAFILHTAVVYVLTLILF